MLLGIMSHGCRFGRTLELVKTLFTFRRLSNDNQMAVRVRFAPSPTGDMHLGGLRTALYNFLFARKTAGQFILRIEDTDQSRLVDGAQKRIVETLRWAGLHPDEGPDTIGGPKGPYVQSQRLHFYKEFSRKLIDNGAAYRCFCSAHRLDLIRKDAQRRRAIPKYDNKCRHLTAKEGAELIAKGTPHVVRFKLKPGPLTFRDVVFGSVTLDTSYEGDFIVLKSDGYPTYHLANVVDDYLMDISHVLRGVEWQLSTPKHIQIFEALGLSPPKYAHLPLMMNQDGTKLSKRNHGFMCDHVKGKYLPETVINFMLLSGGGLGKATGEFYSISDLIKRFNLEHLSTSSCKVDLSRLDDMNRRAIGALRESLEEKAFALVRTRFPEVEKEYFKKVYYANVARLTLLDDLLSINLDFLWRDLPNEKLVPSNLRASFTHLRHVLQGSTFQTQDLSSLLKGFHKDNVKDASYKEFMETLRILLSGLKEGPGVAEMMTSLGKERTISRISRGL
ncbi:probable glutamate--tRNA ligase, mitochondrial isoform X1 [Varroa destructor]|uniref:Nondiscriminating glutamyl-tRNA synthetase EARS2, mitochondrial n=1 Tax=Varroa destructor TaxID=109461 RepID=A0A7M7JXN5_VARDE|nr:probable glutamate--tRNA ligase, mitochondrial isoform X1 [Varroa destructor]